MIKLATKIPRGIPKLGINNGSLIQNQSTNSIDVLIPKILENQASQYRKNKKRSNCMNISEKNIEIKMQIMLS